MYALKRWPGFSAALPASSVATVSFTRHMRDGFGSRRLASSAPTHWPTISGAWICFVHTSSFASPSGDDSAGYEKQKPTAESFAKGRQRLTWPASTA